MLCVYIYLSLRSHSQPLAKSLICSLCSTKKITVEPCFVKTAVHMGFHFAQTSPTRVIYNGDMKTKKKELKMKVLREMKGEENLALPYIDTLHIIKTQHFLEQSEGRSGADLRSGRPRRTQMPACLGVLSTFHPLRVG